jgi:16S rRNA (cytosine967-C5)-methyltransferase
VAYDLLRAVDMDGAYANLLLPKLLTARSLSGRDAAFATELGYGTLRASGTLDEIIATCSERPLDSIDAPVRDLLRLGAYQALRTRVPAHAAVATTVDLARATGNARAGGIPQCGHAADRPRRLGLLGRSAERWRNAAGPAGPADRASGVDRGCVS